MVNGYYLYIRGKDTFVITNATRKTKSLICDVCTALKLPKEIEVYKIIKNRMQKATLEVKTLPNGRKYNSISGDNFGGYGHFLDENEDVIIDIR